MTTASQHPDSPAAPIFLPRVPHLALTHYLPEALVLELARLAGWAGRRRVFDPWVMLWGLVAQALAGGAAQEQVVALLAAALGRSLSIGSGAFCRSRQRLICGLVQAASEHVAAVAQRLAPALTGPRTWLLDGTCLALSDTPANQRRYPQSVTQRPNCGYPVLHLVAMIDLHTGCVGPVAVGSLHDHDAKLARQLWSAPGPGELVLGDRGFASYAAQAAAARRGYYYLFRQHQRRLNAVPLVGNLDDRDELWERPQALPKWVDEAVPAQLTVRVVRCRLTAQTVLVLNTNLPRETHSAAAVVALYLERWRVETRFLELKCHLAAEPLRAATPETVATALWGCLLAFNLVQCLLTEAAAEGGLPRYQVSFTAAQAALGASTVMATDDAEAVSKWVRQQVIRNRLPSRSQLRRDEPRRIKPRHQAYTKLQQPRSDYPEHGRNRVA